MSALPSVRCVYFTLTTLTLCLKRNAVCGLRLALYRAQGDAAAVVLLAATTEHADARHS